MLLFPGGRGGGGEGGRGGGGEGGAFLREPREASTLSIYPPFQPTYPLLPHFKAAPWP